MTSFRAAQPHGKTADFANAVAAKFGVPFVRSWLSERVCRFTDTTVYTTGLGRDRLNSMCSELAAKHGVTISDCPDVTAALRRDVDAKLGSKA